VANDGRVHIGSHPLTETTCDGPGCWCRWVFPIAPPAQSQLRARDFWAPDELDRYRQEVQAEEREACALAVERAYLACTEPGVFNRHVWARIVEEAKNAIRARGEKFS
jgi:hypothetical protein